MQRLEVSGAVRPIYGSLGVKRLRVPVSLMPKRIAGTFVLLMVVNLKHGLWQDVHTRLKEYSPICSKIFGGEGGCTRTRHKPVLKYTKCGKWKAPPQFRAAYHTDSTSTTLWYVTHQLPIQCYQQSIIQYLIMY